MATPSENALSVCLSIYSLFLEKLDIDNQKNKFEIIKQEMTDREVSIGQDLFLGDALCRLEISVTNYEEINYVILRVAGVEFESFQIPNDVEDIVPEFKNKYSSSLDPMIFHIRQLLNRR